MTVPEGIRPIGKILVANRGEIARRVCRSARRMGIATVAVFSDPDSGSPHVSEADEAVRLPGSTAADTYLRADTIVAAAVATRADALHPGYGFLSENPLLVQSCDEAGIVFVGPPAGAIEQMGSKLSAKALVDRAGVPILAGRDVTALTGEELEAAADALGWPVLVKASAGGGGRGMRVVEGRDGLAEAVEGARREALSAFGDETVFFERYLVGARHVEIQILADAQGDTVHLGERDCSVQRRHQKILEEAPSPVVDAGLRSEMGAAAVAAARSVGYVGAGTVEFLVDPASRDFYFLEMNTRLQVEHAVTEAVTGLDLVALQIRIAEGRSLGEEVRAAVERGPHGHAVEARLYAEDPERDFLPATGTLRCFSISEAPDVRVDSGVETGSVVSPFYDPMLAKVIASAPTRPEALRLLASALSRARIHGLCTNRDLLVGILGDDDFRGGVADVQFLDRRSPAELARSARDPAAEPLHALAAALSEQALRRATAPVLAGIPSGWRNNPSWPQCVTYDAGGTELQVTYVIGRSGVSATVGGTELAGLVVFGASPEGADLELGGVRRRVEVHIEGDEVYVDSALGSSTLRRLPRFPTVAGALGAGSLVAPMPGTVARVAVEAGAEVGAGEVVVVIESMKMEHSLRAPVAGRISEVRVAPGTQVEAGAVLAVLEEH